MIEIWNLRKAGSHDDDFMTPGFFIKIKLRSIFIRYFTKLLEGFFDEIGNIIIKGYIII
jgi:hypothetical protein